MAEDALLTRLKRAWHGGGEAALRKEIALFFRDPPGDWGHLGELYNVGVNFVLLKESEAARICLQICLDHRPDLQEARAALGVALADLGKLDEGMVLAREAVAASPDNVSFLSNLGNLLIRRGELEEAEGLLTKAWDLDPGNPYTGNNLAKAVENRGRFSEALDLYRSIVEAHPGSSEITVNLGRLLRSLGRAEEAVSVYDRYLEIDAADGEVQENRLFALLYAPTQTPKTLAEAHLAWGKRQSDKSRPPPAMPAMDGPLRIGFLSPDFRVHSVAYFVAPVLKACKAVGIKVFCYSDTVEPDAMTLSLKSQAYRWRDIHTLRGPAVADMMRADRLHILIELAGHTAGGRMELLAQRPAPLQASWIGYPHPTGLAQIDYFITDGLCSPEGSDPLYLPERLLRLDGPFSCYEAPADAPDPLPEKGGPPVFVSFNNYAKMSDETVAVWAEILRLREDSSLLLKSRQFADEWVRSTVRGRFQAHGIPSERLRFAPRLPAYGDHLALYNEAHVALDTFPYNGTTTTCEALWMGVPVVALAGKSHYSRVGVSLLTHCGHPEWIARSTKDYVTKALALTEEGPEPLSLREDMRTSPLCDGPALVRSLETSLRRVIEAAP